MIMQGGMRLKGSTSIIELELGTLITNCLLRGDIYTVDELVSFYEENEKKQFIRTFRHFGEGCYIQLTNRMVELGLIEYE